MQENLFPSAHIKPREKLAVKTYSLMHEDHSDEVGPALVVNHIVLGILNSPPSLWRKLFKKRNRLLEKYLSPLTDLFKQGGPFTEFTLKVAPTKLLTVVFLSLEIILRKAYKNTNVHNMAAPTKLIFYEFFNDLINDGFIVYSKVSTTGVGFREC